MISVGGVTLLLSLTCVPPHERRLPCRLPKDIYGPPIYRVACGRDSVRFEATIHDGRITSSRITDPGTSKSTAPWFLTIAVPKMRLPKENKDRNAMLEVRFCNLGCDARYPHGISLWELQDQP